MKIFGYEITRNEAPTEIRSVNPMVSTLRTSLFGGSNSTAMKIGVVYRCVNLISDSIASLPLIPYNYVQN